MIITKTLGYCIEALGPDVFIQSVPIVDPQSGLPLDGHYFLFQLISDHVKHAQSHLQFFFEEYVNAMIILSFSSSPSSITIINHHHHYHHHYQTYYSNC